MPDLTLEQVRKAGRFAFLSAPEKERWTPLVFLPRSCRHEHGRFYVIKGDGDSLEVDVFADTRFPVSGKWHHLDGCDCEFCQH